MKLSISCKVEQWRKVIESETQRRVSKIEKLLKRFVPDLVQMHGCIEKHSRKEEYIYSLNLSLPSGTLHATGEGGDVLACVKVAFAEIETQIKKHMSILRKDYEWKRKRVRVRALA